MTAILPLIVLIPLFAAALALVLGAYRRAQVTVSALALTSVSVLAAILLVHVDRHGTVVVDVGAWDAPFGIVLVADRLAIIMVLISALMLLGVLLFAAGQGIADGDRDTPVSIFHPTYLVLAAGLFDAFVAGDLFNMYVGFEMLLSASYVLLTLAGTGARIRAGVTYIIISLTSSIIFLASIAFIYAATGTVTIALIAERVRDLPADVQLILCISLLVAFCVKAAVFPMSFWLPDSYPTAPAPVTAVFAGLLTKVGVYAIIRTDTVMFTDVNIDVPLMVIALLTLLIGVLGALAQADIKRLLSFTLVSHIGYMIFGIAIGSQAALAATIFYIIHHISVQTTLFLATGLVERIGGTTSINRLGGILKVAPFVSVLFFIGAMNLGGIPPFSGFLGKVGLFEAGVDLGTPLAYVLIGAGALTSLLTLYALVRVWNMAFWRSESEVEGYSSPLLNSLAEDPEDQGLTVKAKRVPALMLTASTGMVALTVCLTIFAGPLFDLAARTASDFEVSSTYVDAVFPGGVQ
ncbi:Na+/H+ antiporter subunit D [Mycetocola zhadangensis]|uniref:Na+/H+ antiporter subunit D n=1 Tax=Mycetocola zhadangensis TaxID=1164595 RepID=A0A3L7J495_9MICO|nr:Na+/H+ antiporter subunit D [Mycetocola zhadangensis]RLQ85486.1 Na+/H+ antiporter subunit D [Mycetocola zhadangensis]GGE83043.1 putative cation antiporter NADH dehydrogenase subunit [Mycetocola zhadangensis]